MKLLSLTETKDIVDATKENAELKVFLAKITKLSKEKSEEMRKQIEELQILKVKKEHIVKIIDLLPQDSSDLNKIFVDVSLNEDEINKLLDTIKKHI